MPNSNTMKAIFEAIRAGNVDDVASLVGEDESNREMTTPFGTWLHVAAKYGKLDIVKYFVENGASVNAYGGTFDGNSLNAAAFDGHIEVVKYLVSQGSWLDTSKSERNPLFSAITRGHTEIAKYLIDKGIDVAIKYSGRNMNNMDALAYAREWGRTEIASYIDARLKAKG